MEQFLTQELTPLFEGHPLVKIETAMFGGRMTSMGAVTILCENTHKLFSMGYVQRWNSEKEVYGKMEFDFIYCPYCGKLLKVENK